MRAVRRWLRRFWAEWRLTARRKELGRLLTAHFGAAKPLRLVSRGNCGRDSIYRIYEGDKTLGIMRVVNRHFRKPPLPADYPFQLEVQGNQIKREWAAYTRGAAAGLTPKPLWQTEDALLCEYMPYTSMHVALEKAPRQAWELLCQGARAVQRLHRAGLTHMDVSFANMLKGEGEAIYFIDFEYAPAAGVSPAAQRVYDHLRLLESTWKFIPADLRGNYQPWLDCFISCLDENMRKVDLRQLSPALGRALQAPELGQKIRQVFSN